MFDSLVSVVIPNFNHGKELERAVRSALAQRYLHEVIIVDDCSTDDSFRVAESLYELDQRIAVFRCDQNGGPARARNLGAQYATGHYIAFLDADDEYLPDFFAMTVPVLKDNRKMRAIKAWTEFIDESTGQPLLDVADPRTEALVFSSPNNIVLWLESFRDLGGFSEDPVFREGLGGEDVAFCKAVAKYLEPLGRIEMAGYRAWSSPGDHLDRFLKNTVVKGDSFDFIALSQAQLPGGSLDQAIESYLVEVDKRISDSAK